MLLYQLTCSSHACLISDCPDMDRITLLLRTCSFLAYLQYEYEGIRITMPLSYKELGAILKSPYYLTSHLTTYCRHIGRHSAHHTLLSNMYHHNSVGSLVITTCCLTLKMIIEVSTLLTTHCYLTCRMIPEACSLLTTPCYLTCTMKTEVDTLLTTPCFLTVP